jgi:hypothetical protein
LMRLRRASIRSRCFMVFSPVELFDFYAALKRGGMCCRQSAKPSRRRAHPKVTMRCSAELDATARDGEWNSLRPLNSGLVLRSQNPPGA